MKKLAIFCLFIFSSTSLYANELSGFGLGAMLGDPTALSFKGHLGNQRYFDAALAYKNGIADGPYLHGDYLIEKQKMFKIEKADFDVSYGIGGRAYWADEKKHKDEFHLGVRAPITASYFFKDPSLEVFGELAGIIEVAPETAGDIDFSIGVRYWF